MDRAQVLQTCSFMRAVARHQGALQESWVLHGRPLGEARLIVEAAQCGGADLRVLRRRLGLDSGYMSRLLRSLESQGIVELHQKREDARARHVRLTAKGEAERAVYDALSQRHAQSILAPLSAAQRQRLVAAMGEVERLMHRAAVEIAPDEVTQRPRRT